MTIFDSKKLLEWGIVDYGYTTNPVPLTLNHYNQWVDQENHLPLTYLEGERQEKRQSLLTHWPEFQSSLVFLFSYHKSHQALNSLYKKNSKWNGLKIASYTLGFKGDDYHNFIRERLVEIGESLKKELPELDYKLTLDTHPVLERDLAMRAGMGWFGKNSMLINRHHGSFFIIGSLLLNQKIKNLTEGKIETDHCGQCTRCIEACPTEAIDPVSRTIIANDCISTFTIEQFKLESIPSEKMSMVSGEIFGCDICQDVCPWNKRIDRLGMVSEDYFQEDKEKFILNTFLLQNKISLRDDLESISEGEFKRRFTNTSFERSGRRGLLKNIRLYFKQLNILS